MKNTIKFFGIIVFVVIIGFYFAACDGGGGSNSGGNNTGGSNTGGNNTGGNNTGGNTSDTFIGQCIFYEIGCPSSCFTGSMGHNFVVTNDSSHIVTITGGSQNGRTIQPGFADAVTFKTTSAFLTVTYSPSNLVKTTGNITFINR